MRNKHLSKASKRIIIPSHTDRWGNKNGVLYHAGQNTTLHQSYGGSKAIYHAVQSTQSKAALIKIGETVSPGEMADCYSPQVA